MRPMIPLLLTLLPWMGCPARRIPEGTATDPVLSPPPSLSGLALGSRLPAAGLEALACRADACAWIREGRWALLDPRSLAELASGVEIPGRVEAMRADGATWVVRTLRDGHRHEATLRFEEGRLHVEERPLAVATPAGDAGHEAPRDAQARRAKAWNRTLQESWRVPFQDRIPAPGGGVISYLRGADRASSRLIRAGGGLAQSQAQGTDAVITCTAWLALHPTGQELYLLPWPSDRLTIHDPRDLGERGSVDLGGPSVGLFLDPAGRYLLVSRTAPPDPSELQDFALPDVSGEESEDPRADGGPWLAALPPGLETAVVDLHRRSVVARAGGSFRAWLASPAGGMLLATDREVLVLEATRPGAAR